MTPTTPSGVATRSMTRPFGRVKVASTRPTGSGSDATSSRPRAIDFDAGLVERQTVEERGRQTFRLAVGEIARVGGKNVARSPPQEAGGRRQRAVLLLGGALARIRAAARACAPMERMAARTSASGSWI